AAKPASAVDAHRALSGYDLQAILSVQTQRTVANDYTVRHRSKRYQIRREEIRAGLRSAKVVVEERLGGPLQIRWKNVYLKYRELPFGEEEKNLRALAAAATPVGLRPPSVAAAAKAPPPDHPWRRTFLLCMKPHTLTFR